MALQRYNGKPTFFSVQIRRFFLIFEAFCNLLLHFYVVDHAHATVQDGIKISTMPVLMWPRVSFKNCLAAVTHKFIRYGSGKDMN